MGWVWRIRSLPSSRMVLSYSILALPRPAWRRKFSCPIPPLGALRRPAPPRKTLLLVNLPTTITIVFNKTYFVNKNILEITNKFIPSNQTNFWQKLNNIIKVFNKTISQQKQKSHNTKINYSIVYKFVYNKDKRKC